MPEVAAGHTANTRTNTSGHRDATPPRRADDTLCLCPRTLDGIDGGLQPPSNPSVAHEQASTREGARTYDDPTSRAPIAHPAHVQRDWPGARSGFAVHALDVVTLRKRANICTAVRVDEPLYCALNKSSRTRNGRQASRA